MKVRKEEIGRHRRRSKQPPKRRTRFLWVFLPLILILFYLAYAERALLETYAKRLESGVAGVLGLPSGFLSGDAVQTVKEGPEPLVPQHPAESPVPQPSPDLWTLEQGQAQENKITEQQEKINLLTKEVRYVGAVMRRLSASAEALQSGAASERARLRGIGKRLETLDTNMQAFGEKSLNDRAELNRVMAELQQGLAVLLSDNDANKKRLDQIEASISNLNARLIELEK